MTSFLRSLPQTFGSRAFYADWVESGRGIGLRYILLSAFIGLLMIAVPLWQPWHGVQASLLNFFDALPAVKLEQGRLSLPNDQAPFDKALPPGLAPNDRVLIDPQETESDIGVLTAKMKSGHILVWAMGDKVALMAESDKEPTVHLYDSKVLQTITQEDWNRYGHLFVAWAYPLVLAAVSCVTLVQFLVTFLLAGCLFWVGARMMLLRLSFAAALRLVAAAKVPAMVLTALLQMPGAVSLIAWGVWSVFGLSAVRRHQVLVASDSADKSSQ